jgi:hypothetical protein
MRTKSNSFSSTLREDSKIGIPLSLKADSGNPQPFRKKLPKPIREDRLFWYNKLIGREFPKNFQKRFRFESFGVWNFQESSNDLVCMWVCNRQKKTGTEPGLCS